jgi:membrane-bound lytic murein transglycosylase D
VFAFCVQAVPAEEDLLGTLTEWGQAWYEENIDHEQVTQILSATQEEWMGFWQQLGGSLETGSLEDLAWAVDEAEYALAYLEEIPDFAPYADWLRQRLDYYSMADHVTRTFPSTPKTTAPPRTRRTGTLVTPPRPKSPVPPREVKSRRKQAVQSTAVWKQKLRNRTQPERAEALVPRLKKIFAGEGMPQEMVWLAEVESSFNPKAKSPVGAAGLYQFMPATAREYGMKTKPRDERYDPEKNARGAAIYLKKLYGRFGSWPLALAAYNAGQGRVGKLLRKHQGSTFESIADYLPTETRMYVPKVLATVSLREGIDPQSIPAPKG